MSASHRVPEPAEPGRPAATPGDSASAPVTVLSVVGARPNFMKVAPVARALAQHVPAWRHRIVHTGQHYDANMSQVFFQELGIPEPHVDLGVGSGTHAEQTARVMLAFDALLDAERPDLVIVVGDVNSTLAATVVAVKRGIAVAHVEAGLRSFDRTMPEEINRLLTDAVADVLLTPSRDADDNLRREGVDPARIHFVGNVMIDSLQQFIPRARATRAWEDFALEPQGYALVTLHRPSNVDDPEALRGVFDVLTRLTTRLPVVFPVHPRTRRMLDELGAGREPLQNLHQVEPLGYLQFLGLESAARLVLTDSGGMQEETTILGIPCLTMRPNTERPITVQQGTNRVVGSAPQQVWAAACEILERPMPQPCTPELWDGRSAERIVEVLQRFMAARPRSTTG